WSVQEDTITYHLLVILLPPPGHSFSLEQDTTTQLPSTKFNIHVELQCTCSREQTLRGGLCFLHHPNDKLQKDQHSYLLHTLCTDSYLDVKKTACWFQTLVRTAWLLLPQSHHCQLTVLPSSHSCVFQLTSASMMKTCTEMMFAVQKGNPGAYLN
ncbi:IPIL1 protein, partial [Centropus bengalensis]|nr:IPIL1 protein [Centropus bengalensis]